MNHFSFISDLFCRVSWMMVLMALHRKHLPRRRVEFIHTTPWSVQSFPIHGCGMKERENEQEPLLRPRVHNSEIEFSHQMKTPQNWDDFFYIKSTQSMTWNQNIPGKKSASLSLELGQSRFYCMYLKTLAEELKKCRQNPKWNSPF